MPIYLAANIQRLRKLRGGQALPPKDSGCLAQYKKERGGDVRCR